VSSVYLMRVNPPVRHKIQLSLSSTDPKHVTSHALKEFNFEGQSGDNLPPCNFHGVFAKDMNFEPNVGYCTAVNENLNVQ
jgi:hypothetical protein